MNPYNILIIRGVYIRLIRWSVSASSKYLLSLIYPSWRTLILIYKSEITLIIASKSLYPNREYIESIRILRFNIWNISLYRSLKSCIILTARSFSNEGITLFKTLISRPRAYKRVYFRLRGKYYNSYISLNLSISRWTSSVINSILKAWK